MTDRPEGLDRLLAELGAAGRSRREELLDAFDRLMRRGVVALVKFDGERGEEPDGSPALPYTALLNVGGGRVLHRRDAATLEEAMEHVLAEYAHDNGYG